MDARLQSYYKHMYNYAKRGIIMNNRFTERGAWHRFLALVLALSIIFTSVDVNTYTTYGSVESTTLSDTYTEYTGDITNVQDRLGLSLENWHRMDTDGQPVISDNGMTVDFSGEKFDYEAETGVPCGADLHYDVTGAASGDYFEFVFPEGIDDVHLADGYTSDVVDVSFESAGEDGTQTRVRIELLEDGEYSGDIPLEFVMSQSGEYTVILQTFQNDNTNKYTVIAPLKDQGLIVLPEDQTSEDTDSFEENTETEEQNTDSFEENAETEEQNTDKTKAVYDSNDMQEDVAVPKVNFTIQADIKFDEKVDGVDWKSITRQSEFNQPIKITAEYDDNGEEKMFDFYAQNDLPNGAFYMNIVHDGDGQGTVIISNVSNYITVGNLSFHVKKYSVKVDSEYPYYECEAVEINDNIDSANKHVITLNNTLKTETLVLNPTVSGIDTDTTQFTMNAVFSNPSDKIETAVKNNKLSYKISSESSKAIIVPVGLKYIVTQEVQMGYKLSDEYTIVTKYFDDGGLEKEEKESCNKSAEGTIESGRTTTITTVNYAQNLSKSFSVKWVDNNNSERPQLSADNFKIMYRVKSPQGEDAAEWTEITAAELNKLGISGLPQFDISKASEDRYTYTGLPGVDAEGNPLEFKVDISKEPDGYTSSVDETGSQTLFTFKKTVDFKAGISWLDDSDIEGNRPDKITLNLNMYRRIDGGKYEKVEIPENSLNIPESGNEWTFSVPGLPRYDDNNNEYDYVMVQGEISYDDDGVMSVKTTPVEKYKTYYSNGFGNFGNDTELCHNNGTVKEKIYDTASFTVEKTWKDGDMQESERPAATVTLYRYPMVGNTDAGIDEMYNSGKAARVIYRLSENTEILLSYTLKNDTKETIEFNHSTIPELPENFELPAYDEQGRRYVYFVREIVDSDNYDINYIFGDAKYSQGVPTGGTITNVRREKAQISVNKSWQCPSDLGDIDGVSVQTKILVPNPSTNVMEELTMYSSAEGSYDVLSEDEKSKAQTISGFTTGVSSIKGSFYVNICDSEGRAYDMSRAVIQEVTITAKDGTEIGVSYSDANPGTGSFNLNKHKYNSASSYIDETTSEDGMKTFSYRETNTITGERDYTIVKKWDIPEDERANVTSVNFKLYRRSTGSSNGQFEWVKNPDRDDGLWSISAPDDGNNWSVVIANLLKYDERGYAYQYRAEESSITFSDKTLTMSEVANQKRWYVDHYRTDEQTTAINYKYGEYKEKYFSITKEWDDNGDISGRQNVVVRVYRKKDIKNALISSNISDGSTYIMLGASGIFGKIPYAEYTLSAAQDWYRTIALSYVEGKMQNKDLRGDASAYDLSDYITLEYKVSGDAGSSDIVAPVAMYTYADLMYAVSNKTESTVSGVVSNSVRHYSVSAYNSADGRSVRISNVRTGEVTLNVTKIWKDGSNANNTRPENVRFRIYCDGELLDASTDSQIQVEGNGAAWDSKTGEVTVGTSSEGNNTANTWSFKLTGLPLFSENGIPHTYDVEEIRTSAGSKYIVEKAATEVTQAGDYADSLGYTFTFTNTISDTIDHSAYKYWKDAATKGEDRPDLYLVLYRAYKKDKDKDSSYVPYTDYKDQIWTRGVDGDPCDWKITVRDLPRYDENGNEYIYQFRESMNNDGVTVYGKYTMSAKTIEEQLSDGTTDTYEEFINTLTGTMSVSGDKTWLGLENYHITVADLPSPEIELYRSVDSVAISGLLTKTDSEVNALVESGKIEKVASTSLDNDKKHFLFDKVDKFDSEGRRYIYAVREKLDILTDLLYSKLSAGGTLQNTFKDGVNRRSIKVTKKWKNRDALSDKEKIRYPSVTYYLYRYDKTKGIDSASLYTTGVIKAKEFEDNSGNASYEFKDLLIYSPAGHEYGYYVTEKSINGYSISYKDENGLTDTDLKANSQCDIVSTPTDAFTDKAHVTEVSTTNTYDKPENIKISGTKYWNDYGNSPLIYGHRPESIKVTLKRRTNNESGQNNQIASEDIVLIEKTSVDENETNPYIVWEKSSDGNSDMWRYTIYNLERYAPNGMPYIYSVIEEPVKGYVQKTQTVEINSNDAASNKHMAQLTNSFENSYYVRKNWLDGNNKYGLRPSSVTIVLQRSIKGKNEWKNIGWDDNCKTLPSATTATATDADGKEKNMPVVSVKLTSANVMKNTGGNSWEYTFRNLPKYADADGTVEYEYRCVETAIGSAEFYSDIGDGERVGAYTRTYTSMDENRTVVQNQLESTSLYVEKEWFDDSEDMYHTRPDTLTFVLQMKGIKPDEKTDDTDEVSNDEEGSGTLTDWQDVKINGERYTFTLTRKDNWQTLLQDLPVATVDENDGKTYYALYFRAVELHSDDGDGYTGTIVSGAADYEDVTDYGAKNHYYNDTNSRNEIKISNKLRLDDKSSSITVKKVWRKNSTNEETAEFELLYRRKSKDNNTGWHCMGDADTYATGTENGCRDQHSTDVGCVLKEIKSTDETKTFTWDKLPKYDREGNELEYKVVEHTPNGYVTDVDAVTSEGAAYATDYTFTNIELQDYTVKKIWLNTDYAEKDSDRKYTATFKLQRKIDGSENGWTDVTSEDSTSGDDTDSQYKTTLISKNPCDTKSYTWKNLPMYTVDGKEYIYRAVETEINGKAVSSDTNGSYIASYQYGNSDDGEDSPALRSEPAFADKMTVVTNRMVYGFVNLSKAAAYIAVGAVTADKNGESDKKLAGVEFAIYPGAYVSGTISDPYVTGVKTDENGNLINSKGKYGKEGKYLIAGTYTLVETQTNPAYSKWGKGVTFTVGVSPDVLNLNRGYTGEHGTAWIYTTNLNSSISLGVNYLSEGEVSHFYEDNCAPMTNDNSAYNLESRGVISFTKTGDDNLALDAHDGAKGESKAYFCVYIDKDCMIQVAGMAAAADSNDPSKMVLTDKTQDGSEGYIDFSAIKNDAGIPYLRKASDGQITLLSGEYYIKELTAPAGYRLDNVVRKAVIAKIDTTDMDSALTDVYEKNEAVISIVDSDTDAVKDYKWNNTPNKVVVYKKDQYGRTVDLGADGYLELSSNDENVTFLTGEKTIRLYQNTETPAKRSDGTAFETDKTPNITYDETNGCWTITGLFDSDKSYTLSEPEKSVPANNVQAKSVTFTIDNDGQMKVASSAEETQLKDDPLLVIGDDYKNYYHSATEKNVLVFRDVSRFRKNVILKKVDSVSKEPIQYISFKLYKYDSKSADGTVQNEVSVLPEDSFVTTGESGQIDLSKQDEKLINQITGMPVKYGLDIGKYYFEEIERGASDGYKLAGKIFFEIKSNDNQGSKTEDYEDYAVIEYESNPDVEPPTDGKTATVKNTPVDKTRTLKLTKVASVDSSEKLEGARFTLEYVSINDKQQGQHINITYNCVTDSDGILYLADDSWKIVDPKTQPDISGKGSYTLKEVQAPDKYMTRTESGTSDPVTMLTFKVDSDNEIREVETYKGSGNIVTAVVENSGDSKEKDVLKVEVKNEKTVIYVDKRTDIESGKKTCNQKSLGGEKLSGAKLSIYEGVYSGDAGAESPVSWYSSDEVHELDPGELKENTVYTLHEEKAPVGYLKADDIYFALFGTRDKNNEVVSQLYVWTGSATPASKYLDAQGTWTKAANWSQTTSLSDNILTMVDEAVIAPVDAQKVVGSGDNYEILPGAKFDVVAKGKGASDNVKLGTAVSNEDGYLVWDSIEDSAYGKNLIYDKAGKRVTLADSNVIGNTIILQQNEYGYTFTEVSSPDNAYNEGKSFEVNITADNYEAYRIGAGKYNTDKYIDIVKANEANGYVVLNLSDRNDTDKKATAADLVNPPFEAAFELYKYDAENPDINTNHNNYEEIGLKDVEFTLYKRKADGSYDSGKKYITGVNGLLHIDINEKGTYKLVETKPLDGYMNNNKELIFTVVNDDYSKTLSYNNDNSADNSTHTVVVKDAAGDSVDEASIYDMNNDRIHGTVTLLKVDPDSNKRLNGVKYTLTRTAPEINKLVDKWFPDKQDSLIVETGNTYDVVSTAELQSDYYSGIKVNTAEDAGKLVIKDLQWGTYQLVETKELDGYIISTKTYTFVITQNNRTRWIYDNDDAKTDVQNKKNQLTIKKTDMGTQELSGAQFSIYSVKDGKVGSEPVKVYTSADKTDPDGTVITAGETTVYGIPSATYVLREIKAPAGYEITQDVRFTIGNDGKISGVTNCIVDEEGKVSDDPDHAGGAGMVSFVSENSGNTVTNVVTVKDNPIEVILTKNSKDGKHIDGRGNAVYEIKGVDSATFADGKTTSRTFKGNNIQDELKAQLVAGCKYTITEVTAPAGYEVPDKSATISVAVDGQVTVEGECDFLTADNGNADGIARLSFTDDPIELSLSKVDVSGEEINQSVLGFAEFSVTGKLVSEDGSKIENNITVTDLTTKNFTSALSGRLIANEIYKIEETKAPDGYKLTKQFYIKVDANGQISQRGEDVNSLKPESEPGDKLVVADDPISVTFKKVDENNNPVEGAVFTLTRADDSTVEKAFVNMSTDTQPQEASVWTDSTIKWSSTDSSEGVNFTNHLIAGVQYRLREDRVLYHEVMSNDIEFTVNSDGTITIDQNSAVPNNDGMDAARLDDDKVVMTISNPVIKGTVVLTKYWKESSQADNLYDAGHVLEGAVYTLKMIKDASDKQISPVVVNAVRQNDGTYAYVDGSSDSTDRFITDSQGQIHLTGLPEGTYEFLEVDAPKAYHINNDESQKIQFTIRNDKEAHVELPEQLTSDEKSKLMDTRINAKISLVKYSGADNSKQPIKNALFDVAYSDADEPEDKDYVSIGRVVTDENGKADFSSGVYPGEDSGEGLRRGHYRLTELAADGQMLNKTDGTRNTISFEIGNDIDHEYVVNKKLQTYLDENKLDGVTVNNSEFISLTDDGVVDAPIPTKTVTATKKWSGDDNISQTFRPESIKLQLYREYSDSNNVPKKEKVGEQIEVSPDAEGRWIFSWKDLPAYVDIPVSEKNGEETYMTRLYTYTVEEVEVPTGYTVSYVNKAGASGAFEAAVQDGDTDSVITNTINATQELTIRKILGGGSDEDTFHVRVRLTSYGKPVINNHSNKDGYYIDNYTLYTDVGDLTGNEIKPDNDGFMSLKGGQYITIEIPANISYEVEEKLDSKQTYVTGDNSRLEYTPRYMNKTGTVGKTGITATIRNAVHKSLSITKYDINNKTLAGAEFRIDYMPLADGDDTEEEYSKKYKTNSDGVLVDENNELITPQLTKQGTYRIYETDAPDGYIVPTNIGGTPILLATITVDADDKMSVKTNYVDITQANLTNYDSVVELGVTDKPISIDIAKVDQASKQPISGVTLKLSKLSSDNKWIPVSNASAGGGTDGTWITTGNVVTFTGSEITSGVYMLEEIQALDGYNPVAAPLVFRVDKAGRVSEVSLADSTEDGCTYDLSKFETASKLKNYTITNSSDGTVGSVRIDIFNAKYTDLEITKKDPDGNVLSGVEFVLEYKDSNNGWQKIENSAKLTTDQSGIVTFGKLPDGMYRLTETKTVKGYNLLSAPIEIKIDRNGMVYTADTEGAGSYELSMKAGTDTLLMTVINKKGNALPKTGKQTPNLPKAVLPVVAMVEALMLYMYGSRGRRRRKKGVNGHGR